MQYPQPLMRTGVWMLSLWYMKRLLAGFLAAVAVLLLMPLSANAWGHHHRHYDQTPPTISPPLVVVPIPPSNPTPPPIIPPVQSPNPVSSFTLGAFNANAGTVEVYFTDIGDLYVQPCGKQQFIYLENNRTSNQSIANGQYDSQLKAWSSKLCPNTIISFGHEMNLTENPWGGNPTTFLAAYKHVHDVIGSKVKYAWVANNSDTPGTPQIGQYWPGASYVDIVGEDGFDWGGESLSQALQPNFAILKAYASGNNLPLWITSTGTPTNQASWLTTGLAWARSNGVSGLLYFSENSGGSFALTPAGLAALK